MVAGSWRKRGVQEVGHLGVHVLARRLNREGREDSSGRREARTGSEDLCIWGRTWGMGRQQAGHSQLPGVDPVRGP